MSKATSFSFKTLYIEKNMLGISLDSPVVKISPSIAGDSGLIPGQELRCQRVFQQKKKAKHKTEILLYHFNKGFKNSPHKKKFFKKIH